MANSTKLIIFSCFLMIAISCVEPFDVSFGEVKRAMVVDAVITDKTDHHSLSLSYTRSINSTIREYVTDAKVTVKIDGEEEISYTEIDSGRYQSNEMFGAEYGRNYQLEISLSDGSMYASGIQGLTPSPRIDSIYARYAEIINPETDEFSGGIQFFINTRDESGRAKYFRYEFEETYQIKVPYPSAWEYDPDRDQLFRRDEDIGNCWSTSSSNQILITESLGKNSTFVREFPLRFIPQSSQKTRTRISYLVRQYALNKDAYDYYRRLKANNESGSLFDKQQGEIIGNITSITNPDESVLGFFEVSGVSEIREFFSATEFSDPWKPAPYPIRCSQTIRQSTVDNLAFFWNMNPGLLVFNLEVPTPTMPQIVNLIDFRCASCIDIASNVKPEFWVGE